MGTVCRRRCSVLRSWSSWRWSRRSWDLYSSIGRCIAASSRRARAQLTGLEFRITGRIEARLLPTPTLILHDIEFGRDGSTVRARALHVEYALGAFVRGEWRIDDAQLEGTRIRDRAGRCRPRRLAVSDRLRPGRAFDPAAQYQGRPCHSRQRCQWLALRARQDRVHGRAALAARTGQRRGRLRGGRPSLSLSARHEPRRR